MFVYFKIIIVTCTPNSISMSSTVNSVYFYVMVKMGESMG